MCVYDCAFNQENNTKKKAIHFEIISMYISAQQFQAIEQEKNISLLDKVK